MSYVQAISWIATAGLLAYMLLLSNDRREGWLVAICTQPFFIAVGLMTGAYGLAVAGVFLTVFSVNGWVNHSHATVGGGANDG